MTNAHLINKLLVIMEDLGKSSSILKPDFEAYPQ